MIQYNKITSLTVSYTHLDVYKRQATHSPQVKRATVCIVYKIAGIHHCAITRLGESSLFFPLILSVPGVSFLCSIIRLLHIGHASIKIR